MRGVLPSLTAGLLVGLAAVTAGGRGPASVRRPRTAVARRPAGGERRQLRRVRPSPRGGRPAVTPLAIELVAAVLDAGAAPAAACATVARAMRGGTEGRGGVPTDPEGWSDVARALERLANGAACDDAALEALAGALRLAGSAGVAPAGLVRQSAADERRRTADRRSAALGRLPVLLVLPGGLCLLPAALLLGVVPLILDLLTSALA